MNNFGVYLLPDMMRKRLLFLLILLLPGVCLYAQTATSIQDGPWNDTDTWDTGVVPNSGNTSSIILMHNVNIPNGFSATVDQVSVDIGASLTVDAGGTLTVADDGTVADDITFYNDGVDYGFLTVDGTVICNNLAEIVGTDQGNTNFNAGAVYRHLYTSTEGSIPIANWNATSTVQIQGYTASVASMTATAGGNWNQSFGNFVFNCTLTAGRFFDFAGLLTDVQTDLTISGTGPSTTASVRFSTTQNPTITIGRDLIISGSSRVIFNTTGNNTNIDIVRDFLYTSTMSAGSTTNTTGTTIIDVGRHFSMNASGGQLILSSGSGAGSGSLNITGNFALTAGTITETSSSTGVGSINFVTAATHTYSSSGTLLNSINFSVSSQSTLDVGTSALTGGGSFTLNGTVRLGSTDASGALQNNTTAGNIRTPTGTRSYATGSTIVYSGAGAQFIGDGFPSSGVVNLTIDNSNGVSLSSSLAIVALSQLSLTNGNLSIGSQTLTINGTVTGSGGLIGGATSNLTIGGTGNFGTLTFSGTTQLLNFTLNRTSSGLVTLGGNLTILGTFTHTAGVLAIGNNTFTISGAYGPDAPDDLSVTSGSTIAIDGSGTLPTDVGFSGTTLGTLTLNRASVSLPTTSTITINNLNLLSGTFSNGVGIAIGAGGTVTRVGGLNGGSMATAPSNTTNAYNVVYTTGALTTGPELPTNTTALNNLSKTGTGTLTLGSAITINGTLTLSSGSFNTGANAIDFKGNFVSNAASTLTSSAITFSGNTTISGSSTPTFNNITISGTLTPTSIFQVNGNLVNNGTLNAGSGTTIFGGTTTISGSSTCSFNNVTISGTLTAPAGNFNVAGAWTNNGTFNAGTSTNTVTFNGTSTISGSATTSFAGITISGTLTAPATLNVGGNFTNNGTFNRGTGTVVFNGTGLQNISGSATTDFNNLSITNSVSTVRVQSNQNLRGILTLSSNATFDADGSLGTSIFTLVSTDDDPVADASIATLPTGASVTGNVTVQRFMSIEPGVNGNSRFYRYISAPVQGPAVSQIQATIPITGTFTGTSTCSGCGTSQSMFAYDETGIGDINTGYIDFPATANTETLATGRGYSVFMRGNVAPISTAGNAMWSVRNPINSGTINYPVTFTSSGTLANDGWNLVGNPYPATMDWNAASGWTRSNLTSTIYIPDNGDNPSVVATWNGVTGTNGGSRYIAMGQAFWVKADAASPSMSSTENVKAAGATTIFFREGSPSDLLRITLRKGEITDESVIHFRPDATDGIDAGADAYKLKNSSINLATLSNDIKLAINSMSAIACGKTVPLDITDVAAGGYSLDFSEFDSFDATVKIELHDVLLNTVVDIRQASQYPFEVTADANSFGANRFYMTFAYENIEEVTFTSSESLCSDQNLTVSVSGSDSKAMYTILKDNSVIAGPFAGNGGQLSIEVLKSNLVAGLNNLYIKSYHNKCEELSNQKLIAVEVKGFPVVTAENKSNCGAGSVELSASGASEGAYRWYESETGSAIEGQTASTFTAANLNKTKTYYVSAVNSLGCEGAKVPVMAEIKLVTPVEISIEGQILTSSYESGNQWYRNGETIEGATGKSIEVTESGFYEVEVSVNGCTTRVGQEMSVTAIDEYAGGISLFPNPVAQNLEIALPVNLPATGSVRSQQGQEIGTIEFKSSENGMKGQFNFTNRSSGLYFVTITQGNVIRTYKIVKK
jgi:hypothetical protein